MPTLVRSSSMLLGMLAAAALSTVAGAHDFWIQPATFASPVGSTVALELMVGHHGDAEARPRDPARLLRFICAGPRGLVDVPGVNGSRPAGLLRLEAAGPHVVAYESTYSTSDLPAEKFEAYLAEVGLERVAQERAARGATGSAEREAYMRCPKAIVVGTPVVGSPVAEGAASAAPAVPAVASAPGPDLATPLGLRLEFVPRALPAAIQGTPSSPLGLTLLFEGKPIEGVLVVAKSPATGRIAGRARTGPAGEVAFPLEGAGPWLVTAVHMVPAGEKNRANGAAWESMWASLSFELPATK